MKMATICKNRNRVSCPSGTGNPGFDCFESLGSHQYHKITHGERWQDMVQRITKIPEGTDLMKSPFLKEYLLAKTSSLISGDTLNPETSSATSTNKMPCLSGWTDVPMQVPSSQ